MTMTDEQFSEMRAEWRQALDGIIAGLPDRTDLMLPMSRILNPLGDREPTIKNCLVAVSRVTGFSEQQLKGERRYTELARARAMACLLAFDQCEHRTYPEIARALKKDHSGIRSAVLRARRLVETDELFRVQYYRAEAMVVG